MRNFALASATALFCISGQIVSAAPEGDGPLRAGIVKTLFRGMPDNILNATLKPFGLLTRAQTGLDVDLTASPGGMELASQMESGELRLGIFQGIEFAWAVQKYPDLRPLMLPVYGSADCTSCLIVRKRSGIRSIRGAAKGSLAIPIDSRLHCHLYLDRLVRRAGGHDARNFFKKVSRPADAEEALDDVVDGSRTVALVDTVAWRCYERLKPSRAGDLFVLCESEPFPASIVAYRAGTLPSNVLRRLKSGMLAADKQPMGRQLLTLWKLTGFERVPTHYQELTRSIVQDYPYTGHLPPTYPVEYAQTEVTQK